MKGDQVYLRHILDAIEKIESYISVGRDIFLSNGPESESQVTSY